MNAMHISVTCPCCPALVSPKPQLHSSPGRSSPVHTSMTTLKLQVAFNPVPDAYASIVVWTYGVASSSGECQHPCAFSTQVVDHITCTCLLLSRQSSAYRHCFLKHASVFDISESKPTSSMPTPAFLTLLAIRQCT